MSITVQALHQIINSGTQPFPLYIGFLKAEELLQVAEVPNFKDSTPNFDIATNVLSPPVKQWQRPLIPDRRDKIINTFDGSGEFMPNPVLVAERCVGGPSGIKINTLKAIGGIPTPVKEIEIPIPGSDQSPPLWIIDGQHRITGLGDSKCKQRDNPIPVVLLLNDGGGFYNGKTWLTFLHKLPLKLLLWQNCTKSGLLFPSSLISTTLRALQAIRRIMRWRPWPICARFQITPSPASQTAFMMTSSLMISLILVPSFLGVTSMIAKTYRKS